MMKFQDLSNKTIAIWGMGKEGVAVQQILEQHTLGCQFLIITEENTSDILKADVLVKSPGVSLYRQEIQEAIQKGVICTSGTNIFFSNKPDQTKVIAVTGTKGKSTTSSLLFHTLKTLGANVGLAGNIGKPLVLCLEEKNDFIIAELSSYQTADLKGDVEIAILTNLYPEHLQWHETHERYYDDKINLLNQSKQAIVNAQHEKSLLKTSHLKNRLFFNKSDSIYHKDGLFYENDTPLFETASLPLKGEHNIENACAVLCALKQLGYPLQEAEKAFKTFTPLPHRLQILGQKDKITYVDDSISTTPETAIAAVKAFLNHPFITLIVGGMDRGQDYNELASFLSDIKDKICLITLPDTGFKAYQAAKKRDIFCLNAQDMSEAVALAKTYTKENGVVLLSPGAPSYNLYKNFEERGQDFEKNVF